MKTVKLGDIAKISSGGTPSKSNSGFWGGKYPWVTAKDLKRPIINESIDTLTDEGYYRANIAKQNSLLILVRGMTLHKDVPICIAGRDVAFNQDIKSLSIDSTVDVSYLAQYLKSKKNELLELVDSAGHGTGRLDTELLRSVEILLPPLPEQKAIADLLSTWDKAIEKAEKLIAAKEKQFQWLMDELITKPSKSGKWSVTTIACICSVVKGQQLNVEHMVEDGQYYALNGGVTASGRTSDWNTPEYTITISEGGNSCGYISYNTERFWAGGHCYTLLNLQSSLIDVKYLFHFLKLNETKIMKLRVGSGLPNIQKKDIDAYPVLMPHLQDQKRISGILDLCSYEINLLRSISDKYKLQKRGLMQKLLNGQWRVKGFK